MTNYALALILTGVLVLSLFALESDAIAIITGLGMFVFMPWTVVRLLGDTGAPVSRGEQLNLSANAVTLGGSFVLYLITLFAMSPASTVFALLLYGSSIWAIVNMFRMYIKLGF